MPDALLEIRPDPVPWSEGTESVHVTWAGPAGAPCEVRVSFNGGPEQVFAVGHAGTRPAPWIRAGSEYEFRLCVVGAEGPVARKVVAMQPRPAPRTRWGKRRSNVAQWQQLQEQGYFEEHPYYQGLNDLFPTDLETIESFVPVRGDMRVVIIGCGYGRESARIAPRVGHIWGIDVSQTILRKAEAYLGSRGITNFTGVQADAYAREIPAGIDLVYSIVVMQHLTRDLVRAYVENLGRKLAPDGVMLIQFLEDTRPGRQLDAELKVYEPSVSWTIPELHELAAESHVRIADLRTEEPVPGALWHWVLFARDARNRGSSLGSLARRLARAVGSLVQHVKALTAPERQ